MPAFRLAPMDEIRESIRAVAYAGVQQTLAEFKEVDLSCSCPTAGRHPATSRLGSERAGFARPLLPPLGRRNGACGRPPYGVPGLEAQTS